MYQTSVLSHTDTKLWDPYDILGIAPDTPQTDIKKAFKKLSLLWHPDKVKDNKLEAEAKFIDISKAYKTLTDPDTLATFREFGHPDGKQAFKMMWALPVWLVGSGSSLTLLFYAVVFGIGLPIVVAKWWSSAKLVSKNKVL